MVVTLLPLVTTNQGDVNLDYLRWYLPGSSTVKLLVILLQLIDILGEVF